jgi:hypothetical protein
MLTATNRTVVIGNTAAIMVGGAMAHARTGAGGQVSR